MNTNYDITEIEDTMFTRLSSLAISSNIFVGGRRKSVTADMSDFITVSVGSNIDDLRAYGTTVVNIGIYIRNFEGGLRDSVKHSTMFNAVLNALPYETGKYRFSYDTNSPIVQDGLGFSVQFVSLLTFIKHN